MRRPSSKVCVACHTFDKGGKSGVGPEPLRRGRRTARTHEQGFNYSAGAEGQAGQPWTFDELNEWLHKPSAYAPGTRMAFAGITNDKQRADVIAYLRTLSDNPEPLPSPEQAPAAAAAGRARRRRRLQHRSRRPDGTEPASPPELDRFLAAAEAAADVAGAVVRPFFRAGFAIDTKSDRSPVTIADRSAEQAMRAVLAERFPDHGVLGEEFGLDRPEARLRWVLDPIDGTRAFVSGRPTFGTLIALLDGETPILGVIDQPVSRERWIGAVGRRDRVPRRVWRPGGLPAVPRRWRDAELSCTSPEMLGPDQPRWQRLVGAVRRNYWGGDCYAHGLLALGQIDVIAETTMKLWDWAALVPVVEGAGGRVTDWSGQTLRPGGDGRVLSVGDPALLPQIVALLN